MKPKPFHIELTKEEYEAVEELRKSLNGSITKKVFFNNLIALMQWALKERKSGKIIASIDEENQKIKELCMAIFP